MSVEAWSTVLHHSRAVGTDKVVLLGIANHVGHDGTAWPTVATLARYSNVDTRTVRRSLTRLVDSGELAIARNAGGTDDRPNHERPNRYRVEVTCPAQCDRTPNHRLRPLPQAPADLWTDPLTLTSPPDADVSRGRTQTSGEGVTLASPKPSSQPHVTTSRSDVTTPRARIAASRCDVCGKSEVHCRSAAATSGHEYRPVSA